MIQIDDRELKKLINTVNPKTVDKLIRGSVNAAARQAKRSSIKTVQKEYKLKTKDIGARVKLRLARGSQNESRMKFYAVPLALNRFRVAPSAQGLKATVYKNSGATILPGAFQAKIGGTTKNFIRTEALKPVVRKFVTKPSKRPAYRSPKGHALPINRLWADPDAAIVDTRVLQVIQEANEAMGQYALKAFDKEWEKGNF